MIYVTGDTHGLIDFDKLFFFALQRPKLTKQDYVIICGDFGGVWGDLTAATLDCFSKLPFTTLFVDGNHENYDKLQEYPVSEWNGGKVQFIRPDIIHLMRGQVYTMDGKTIFTMGGAVSHDKAYRKPGVSWWREELPTAADFAEARKNLTAVNYVVDYIITHSCDAYCLHYLSAPEERKEKKAENDLLCKIEENVTYQHWYFGHYHLDENVNAQKTALYQQVIPLGQGVRR